MTALKQKSFFNYFFWVYILSIPFWYIGGLSQNFTQSTPIKLPLSALMAICPSLAALILLFQQRKGHKFIYLLFDAFNWRSVTNKMWLIFSILLMPFIGFISHLYGCFGDENPFYNPFSILEIIIFFIIFFIGAICEEIGWSGFIKKPMIKKYGALKAGLGIGFVWAIWHLIPYIQMNKAISWIIIQSICTILLRIIMVWLFQNNNQSLFLMSLFHSMVNISPYLFSKSQVNYEPIVFLGTLLILSLVLIGFYEPRRFIGFRKLKF